MLWQLMNNLHMTCSYWPCSTVAEQFLEPNSMYVYSSLDISVQTLNLIMSK